MRGKLLNKHKAGDKKANLVSSDINFLVGGDLLSQLIATSFGVSELEIPMLGIYGACSTMGEAMIIASLLVDGGYAKNFSYNFKSFCKCRKAV